MKLSTVDTSYFYWLRTYILYTAYLFIIALIVALVADLYENAGNAAAVDLGIKRSCSSQNFKYFLSSPPELSSESEPLLENQMLGNYMLLWRKAEVHQLLLHI